MAERKSDVEEKAVKKTAFEVSGENNNEPPPAVEEKKRPQVKDDSQQRDKKEEQQPVTKPQETETKRTSDPPIQPIKKYSKLSALPPAIIEDLRSQHAQRYSRVSETYSNVSEEIADSALTTLPKKSAIRGSDSPSEVPSFTEKKLQYLDSVEKTSDVEKSDLTDKKMKLRFGDEETTPDIPRPTSKGMRFEYGRCPRACEKYLNVEEFSRIFVDEITEEAICYIESKVLSVLYYFLLLQQKKRIIDNSRHLKWLKESYMLKPAKNLCLLQVLAPTCAFFSGQQLKNLPLNLERAKFWSICPTGNSKKTGNTASTFCTEKAMQHVISTDTRQSSAFPVKHIQYHRRQPACILRSKSLELDLSIALWMCIIALKLND